MSAGSGLGARLRLTEFVEDDLETFREWVFAADPERVTCRPPRPMDLDSMRARLLEAKHAGTSHSFAVRRLTDDAFVARVVCFDINPRNGAAEIGYSVGPPYQGQGFGREAVALLLAYIFDDLGLNKVMAQTGAFNEPSLRLLRSLGFREDGRLRQHHRLGDELHDDVLMSLLAAEYRADPSP